MLFPHLEEVGRRLPPSAIISSASCDGLGRALNVDIQGFRGSECIEIIDPCACGRSPDVLTLLNHKTGEHRYEVCKRISNAMAKKDEITTRK